MLNMAHQLFSDTPRVRRSIAALGLGAVVLAAVRVSTLPNDLVFMLPAVAVAWVAVFVALRARRPAPRLAAWVAVPCWLWLLWLMVNPFYSAWPEVSIWFGLIFALIPASVLGLHKLLADDRVWNRLEWGLFGVAGLVATAMLFEYFVLGLRSDGPFPDANVASAVLYAVLLPLLYRLLVAVDQGGRRWLLAALAVLLAAGLYTGFSRAGVGSFYIALAGTAVAVLVMARRAVLWRFVGCLLLVAVAYTLVYYGSQQPYERNLDNLTQDHSLQARFLMWESTLDIYAEAPLLGRGLGTYKIMYPRYRSRMEAGTSGDMAHNDYLQVLAGAGPLMLALLAGFVLLVLYTGLCLLWRIHRTRGDPEQLALLRDLGLCAALLALAVHATVNFIFYVLLLSLLAGLYSARLAGRYGCIRSLERRFLDNHVLRSVVRPVFGVAALVSVVSVGSGIVTEHTLRLPGEGGGSSVSVQNPSYQVALAVSYLNPLSYAAQYYVARAESVLAVGFGVGDLGTGLAAEALGDLKSTLAAKRPDCKAQVTKGILLEAFRPRADKLAAKGLWEDPVTVFEQAIAANPTCMAAYVDLARLYAHRDKLDKAITVLVRATDWLHIATVRRQSEATVLVRLADYTARLGDRENALRLLRIVIGGAPQFEPAQTLLAELEDELGSGLAPSGLR